MVFQTMSHTDVLQFFSFLQLKHQEFVSFSCLKHCVFWYWIHRVINFQNLLYTSKVIAKKPDLYHFLGMCVFSVGHLHKSRHNPQINVLGACWFYFFCSLLCLLPNNNFCSSFPIEICQKTRLYRSLRGEKSVWDMTGTCSRYSI